MQKRKSRRCIQIWQMNLHSILQVDKKESLQCLKYENMFLKKENFYYILPFRTYPNSNWEDPGIRKFCQWSCYKSYQYNDSPPPRHFVERQQGWLRLPDKEMFSVKCHFPHWRLATQLPVTFVLLLDRSKQIGFFVISRSISFVLSYIGKDNKD